MEALKKLLISTKSPGENKSTKFVFPTNAYDEVYPGIILGNSKLAKDFKDLSANKVTHVLNCSQGKGFAQVDTDAKFYEKSGITLFGIPAKDVEGFKLSDHFTECTDFIEQSLQAGGRIYVHCHQGLSRSATIVIAFLMLRKGMDVTEAAKTVRTKRPVLPNDGFLRQLYQLNTTIFPAGEADCESRSTDDANKSTSSNDMEAGNTSVKVLKNLLTVTKTPQEMTSQVHTSSYDEVYPGVLLGNHKLAKDFKDLSANNVTHVLNCSQGNDFGQVDTDGKFYEANAIKFLGIPAQDDDEFDLSDHFSECAEFIENCLQTSGRIYVHCHQGLSRSAAIVIAFLMLKKGMDVTEAAKTVRTKRFVLPNDGFLEQLCQLNSTLLQATGGATAHDGDGNKAGQTDSAAANNIPPLMFFDLETTGFVPDNPDITQIAAICGDQTFDCYVLPTKPVNPGASSVTGICMQDGVLHHHGNPVQTKNISEALQDFLAFIHRFNKPILVAHNAKRFDVCILLHHMDLLDRRDQFESRVSGFLDTLEIAKVKVKAERYNQPKLVEMFVGRTYDAHNAINDVLALSDLYAAKLTLNESELETFKFGLDEVPSV